jgi:hypothetical protein
MRSDAYEIRRLGDDLRGRLKSGFGNEHLGFQALKQNGRIGILACSYDISDALSDGLAGVRGSFDMSVPLILKKSCHNPGQ